MAARALSSITISFGLVSIPVKLYSSGNTSAGFRFNMLHEKCGSRLKQLYHCPQCDETVGRDDIVKGYEVAKGQYVTFTPDELKALEAKSTQSIEITEFLPTSKIDPVYFDKSYYLGPDKGGARAYKLLTAALVESGRSALAKYAARGKMYVVLLRPYEGGIVMQQLRYADELRPISEVPLGDAEVNDAELKLATQIIEQGVAEEFRPDRYEDEVRKRIEALVEQKVEGREIAQEPEGEPKAKVIDLMDALKESLARTGARKPPKRAARTRGAKARGKKAKSAKQ